MSDAITSAAARRKARRGGWLEQIKTELDEKAACLGYYYSPPAADHVIAYFDDFLRHTKGRWAGQPFSPLPWQEHEILRPIFGWMRPDGTRRSRVAYIEIPKKNGKSTLAAGVALYLLTGDGEQRACVYLAAVDRIQAGIVFSECDALAGAHPALASVLRSYKTTKTITFESTGSNLVTLSKETLTQEGIDGSGTIFDELHAQKTRVMWDTLRYAGAARSQPLLFSITTAGWDRQSICWEQHQYAKHVMAGRFEDFAFFPYISAADDGEEDGHEADDWTAEATWHKANPSLGVTISLDDFRADFEEAQRNPAKENNFKRYRLNLWTQRKTRWLSMPAWRACSKEAIEEPVGEECWGGLDLASTRDTCALCRLFKTDAGYDAFFDIWIPEEGMHERELRDFVPYSQWLKAGLIRATEGEITDYDVIMADVKAAHERTPFKSIGIDPHNATHMTTHLGGHGIDMVPFGQTITNFTAPCKLLDRLVTVRGIRFGGNQVAEWQAGNTEVYTNANEDIRPVKPKGEDAKKIDVIVALLMALGRAMLDEEETSVYDDEGIFFL